MLLREIKIRTEMPTSGLGEAFLRQAVYSQNESAEAAALAMAQRELAPYAAELEARFPAVLERLAAAGAEDMVVLKADDDIPEVCIECLRPSFTVFASPTPFEQLEAHVAAAAAIIETFYAIRAEAWQKKLYGLGLELPEAGFDPGGPNHLRLNIGPHQWVLDGADPVAQAISFLKPFEEARKVYEGHKKALKDLFPRLFHYGWYVRYLDWWEPIQVTHDEVALEAPCFSWTEAGVAAAKAWAEAKLAECKRDNSWRVKLLKYFKEAA
jgi:hypothetical protein